MTLDRKLQTATAAAGRRREAAPAMQRQPAPAAPSPGRALQQRVGNQGTQALARSGPLAQAMQRKPTVSAPDDPLERQADVVAERIMRMPADPPIESAQGVIQRMCKECNDEEEEKGRIHRTKSADSGDGLDLSTAVQATQKSGTALPADVRSFFEPRFGHDFSDVRVHTGDEAVRGARAAEARAYTIGRDIVFGAHEYAPGTAEGRRLLAHELTHVIQQDGGSGPDATLQRACGPAAIGAPAGCTARDPVFLSGYPTYRYDVNCDTTAAGERARMVNAVRALPATAQFEIHGFASMDGDAAFNHNLACARALRAQSILTAAPPGGAGVAAARIIGVFNHGPTPGPEAARQSVVLAPRTPTPLPSPAPAAGPTDFRIERVGTSTRDRIFFARGSAVLDAAARTQIGLIRGSAPAAPLRLIGYASADEVPALAQTRANVLRAALTAPPGGVPVSSAVGNAAATQERGDFSEVRSVEVLVGAAAPATLDCRARDLAGNPINPPRQACTTMDPPTWTAFNQAWPIAEDAMTRADNSVRVALTPRTAAVIDRFFGNHNAATLTALRINLRRLKDHVHNLPATTRCGAQCDIGGCEKEPIAYNTDVDAASRMTLCVPTFKNLNVNDRARNLIHESAHGTSPLGGPTAPAEGTKDVAYRHERMMFQLSPADRLRNSDSYALYAMFLREVQLTNNPNAAPAGIQTPATDTLAGFSASEERALRTAVAHLEKRLTWSKDHSGQLYGQVVEIRRARAAAVGGLPTAATLWAASWARNLMTEAARLFPLTAPPGDPVLNDQLRLAAIHERYERMKRAVKRNLTFTRVAAGQVHWVATGGASIADASLQIGGDFFRASPADRIALLLERLAGATRGVEPAFVPAYVNLARWIHEHA